MSMRSLIRQGLPALAEVEQVSLLQQVWQSPLLAPARLFVQVFLDFRPWWPVLIPLLVFEAWRSYGRERQRYQAERASRGF